MTPHGQPYFRFFPAAYDTEGTFERSDRPCDACGRASEWLYVNTIYARRNDASLCARCIAAGRSASVLGDDYAFHDAELAGADAALEAEVLQRTPGFSTFNAFEWPVDDAGPLAFLGYGSDPRLWADERLREKMKAFWRAETGDDLDGPTEYVLVFKSLDGDGCSFWRDLD